MSRGCEMWLWFRGVVVAVALVGGGCERAAAPGSDKAAGGAASPKLSAQGSDDQVAAGLPPDLFVSVEPPGARDVAEVKRDAKEGAEVVVRGRIGGRKDPFVQDRALFLLTDLSLIPCSNRPGDKCPTPWDYCCEVKEIVAANSVTVQVADQSGKPLKRGLAGAGGLRPGAEVVVQGRVAQESAGQVLVISATALFLSPDG